MPTRILLPSLQRKKIAFNPHKAALKTRTKDGLPIPHKAALKTRTKDGLPIPHKAALKTRTNLQ